MLSKPDFQVVKIYNGNNLEDIPAITRNNVYPMICNHVLLMIHSLLQTTVTDLLPFVVCKPVPMTTHRVLSEFAMYKVCSARLTGE